MTQITLTLTGDITKEVLKDSVQVHDETQININLKNIERFNTNSQGFVTINAADMLFTIPLKKDRGTIIFLNNGFSGINRVDKTGRGLATFDVKMLVVKETVKEIKFFITCNKLLEE